MRCSEMERPVACDVFLIETMLEVCMVGRMTIALGQIAAANWNVAVGLTR
jgi:hypothetical protein